MGATAAVATGYGLSVWNDGGSGRATSGARSAVDAAGRADRVLTMTVSEFGRRPGENGSGTDHGTAAPHFLIGAGVRGGRYGAPPSLTALDPHGNLVATTDFRALYATVLGGWFAVDPIPVLGAGFGPLPVLV